MAYNEQLVKLLSQSESVHKWEPKQVLLHIAFLATPGTLINEHEVVDVFRTIHLPTMEVWKLLDESVEECQLVRSHTDKSVFPHNSFYYMDLARRNDYERWLKELQREARTALRPELREESINLSLLVAKVPNLQERAFLEETLGCLELGQCRAAILLGWNLASHHLRHWVFTRKLKQFNDQVARDSKGAGRQVVRFEEFPEDEWVFLGICDKAGLLGPAKDVLTKALKRRDRFRYPGIATPNEFLASEHVASLLEHVVLGSRFIR